jgi:hypothetical protein
LFEGQRVSLNSIAGEVHAIENQRSWVKITIDLGDDEQFVANLREKDYFADPIEISERAVASWQAVTCACWRRPGCRAGLASTRDRRRSLR